MSGLVGKGSRSYKKQNVSDSSLPTLGIRNFIMAFEQQAELVAGGSVTLADSALVVPPEMLTNGFQQPTGPEITNAQLGTFRNNVSVTSNLNGVLVDRVAYTITDEIITFVDGLNADEIIVIKRGNEVTTGNRIVDARPLRASGTVDFSTIGSSPVVFQTGEGFRIAPSTTATGGIDNRQIGFVQVYVDGVLQARNVGNEDESTNAMADQTGNYREVLVNTATNAVIDPQNGVTANAIQFNQFQPFSSEEGVIVISTNLIVDAPNNTGVLDQVDNVQNQVTANATNIAANAAELATIPAASSGTSGQVLGTDGSNFIFEDLSSGGGFGQRQMIEQLGQRNPNEFITPGSTDGTANIDGIVLSRPFTWTCPDDVTAIFLMMAGGGANGKGQDRTGTGGGAGAYWQGWLRVVPGEVYNINVGDASPQVSAGSLINDGETTSISGTLNGASNNVIQCRGGNQNAGGALSTADSGDSGEVIYTTFTDENVIETDINEDRLRSFNLIDDNPAVANNYNQTFWNSTTFGPLLNVDGSRPGLNNAIALGSQNTGNAGGGGAGWLPGEVAANGTNRGGPGGVGGIRIAWFSSTNLAANNGFVAV